MRRSPLLPTGAALALALGCGSGEDATAPGDDSPPSRLPAELVGTWRFQQILDQTCDPTTGQCVPTSAWSESLRFTVEGRFEHALYADATGYRPTARPAPSRSGPML